MGMTCLAIASMTALYIGLVMGNSRDKREPLEQQATVGQTESGKLGEELNGEKRPGSRYQL